MKSFIVLIAFACMLAPLAAQAPEQLEKLSLTRGNGDSEGCIYIDSAPDQYTTMWGNICDRPMQFTIEWSGHHPATPVTYHINGRDVRVVARIDTSGVLTSEAAAAPGTGDKTDQVEVQKKDIGMGQTVLVLVDPETRPAFVSGAIAISKDGKKVRDCKLDVLVNAEGSEKACVLFGEESFEPHFEARLDPN